MKKLQTCKRLLSILLCLAMVLTMVPCIVPAASAASTGGSVEHGTYIKSEITTNEPLFNATRTDFRDESVYTLMITRFNDGDSGNNVHCWDDAQAGNPDSDPAWRGDFKGLVEKLDYIKALGFTAVRLTPVAQNASGYDYHGMHPVDLMSADYRYETDGYTYQDLIEACHAKGLKVMQDVVLNSTSNFGEAYLRKMFEIDKTAGWSGVNACMIPTNVLLDAYPDYSTLHPGLQFQARLDVLKAHKTSTLNADEHYHREMSMGYESYLEQQGSIAGDCVDINTENPEVAVYLAQTCKMYAQMGVDAICILDAKHINRWTLNSGILPALREMLEKDSQDIEIFYEVVSRVRETWNCNIPSSSVPFYSWAETEEEWIGNWDTTSPTANIQKSIDHYNAHLDPSTEPTSTNAFLNGITYHAPDDSQSSGMKAFDFTMMWNFENAGNAYRAALEGDRYMNDATWNLMSVDSINYGPDGMQNSRYSLGSQAWAENLNLMFTFRGIPSILYGTEVEFAKGVPLNMGPNAPLAETGRAYYGDYMAGSVETDGFLDYSASGTVADTLNSTLATHIRQLNAIRMKVPALRKGQYTTSSDYVAGNMAFIRRYTNTEEAIDSLALVTITTGATFKGIPNGKYVDAVNGDVINVTNGTLTATAPGAGSLAVYVCCAPGFTSLDAQFGQETYQLDFDLNGAEGSMPSVETDTEGYAVLPAFDGQAPAGMAFKAWAVSGEEYQAGDRVKLTENTTATAMWEEAGLFDILYSSMTMGNSLAMNFAFEKGHVADWTGHYAEIVKVYADGREDAVQTVVLADWKSTNIGGVAHYYVTFNGIAAKEMTDNVYVTIYDGEGNAISNTFTESVRGHAMRSLTREGISDLEKTMVVDMLNYGAAAQAYFSYNTADLANAELTEAQKALATESTEYEDRHTGNENYFASNLLLKSNIRLMFAFRNVTTDMKAVITFTDHYGVDKTITVEGSDFMQNGSFHVITVEDMVVADSRQDITCTIYNGEEIVATATDSVEGYAARKGDILFEYLMKFSDSAYAFFHN